ncbi:fimbrial biogenesis chaperone [Lysobacter fragariae]
MRRAWTIALAGALGLFASAAGARGQLQAGPTLVELAPGATAGRLTLSNTGDAPVAAQVRAFAWSQESGEDKLRPTTDLALSPAIVQIAPGASQVVRVVRIGPANETAVDATYRVVVDELPGADTATQSGIQFRMRYVVPVYLRSASATPPALTCRLQSAELACRNSGGQAAQLGASRLVDGKGHALPLSPGLFGYVLPGSERRWALPAASPALAELRLETRINGKSATVPVAGTP